jgi:hypothetical protein
LRSQVDLEVAVGKEGLFESSALEARGQTSVHVMDHIVVHGDGIVLVYVALGHHLVGRAQQLDDATTVPRELIDCVVELCSIKLSVFFRKSFVSEHCQ